MKIFRLAGAELGKLLHRPAIYLMTAFLALALVITAFTFNPATKPENLTNFGTPTGSVSEAFSIFNSSTSIANAKPQLEASLTSAYEELTNFSNTESEHEKLLSAVESLNAKITTNENGTLPQTLFAFSNNPNDLNRTALNNCLEATNESIRNGSLKVYNQLTSLAYSSNIDFYTTIKEIEKLGDIFLNLAASIPVNIETLTNEQIIEVAENIRSTYPLNTELSKIQNFKKITIKTETMDEIVSNYYTNFINTPNTDNTLTILYEKIENYAHLYGTSTEAKNKTELNKLITEYKNATFIAVNLIENHFKLAKASGISNSELKNYIGFKDYNLYDINEKIVLNEYLLENQIFHGEIYTNFEFGAIAGNQATAYDFAFYALQILSIVIAVFCMFFAVSITSGEFQNGTIKMVATRPFKRRKLISGKTFACWEFMGIFLLFSTIASLAIGIAMNGISLNTHYLVFNASTVVALPDFAVFLIYLASLALNIIFYIAIAFLLSTLFRSSTIALFGTFIIYFFGLLFNAIAIGTSWIIYTPFAHLDLSKYLGNASATNGFLSMNITSGGNFILSAIVLVGLIILIQQFTKSIFQKRDIS